MLLGVTKEGRETGDEIVMNSKYFSVTLVLQCNELNRGHPTFFYQSQVELRTKESELVHFGPITNERLAVKSCLFPSTKRQLEQCIHC